MTRNELRGRLQSIALYVSIVGLGWGLGVIWTAAVTMQAAPSAPPEWAFGLLKQYRTLAGIGAALLLSGALVVFSIDYMDPAENSDVVDAD